MIIVFLTVYWLIRRRYASGIAGAYIDEYAPDTGGAGRRLSYIVPVLFVACLISMSWRSGVSFLGVALSLVEPCLAVCFFERRDISRLARTLVYWGIIALWVTQSQGIVEPGVVGGHFLAPWHILCSRVAKAYLLCAIVRDCLSEGQRERLFWRSASWWVGASIVLGMIWAHDASDWGAFWQWDYIELSQLAIFVASFAASRSTHFFWTICAAVLWLGQWFVVYQLPGEGVATRHQYGFSGEDMARALAACVVMAFYIVCVYGLRRGNANRVGGTAPRFERSSLPQSQIAAGVALLSVEVLYGVALERHVENLWVQTILYISFGLIWGTVCWRMPMKRYVAVMAASIFAMIGVAWGNGKIEACWIGIEGASDSSGIVRDEIFDDLRLEGIRIEKREAAYGSHSLPNSKVGGMDGTKSDLPTENETKNASGTHGADLKSEFAEGSEPHLEDCLIYWAEISVEEKGGEPSVCETSFEACTATGRTLSVSYRMRSHADVVHGHRYYRLSSARYDARYGVLVFVRERTFAVMWMCFFVGLCVWGAAARYSRPSLLRRA